VFSVITSPTNKFVEKDERSIEVLYGVLAYPWRGGKDMFGDDTFERPWNQEPDPLKRAELKVYAGFELMQKLGIEYFCFHDRDIARKGDRSTKRIKTLTRSSP